MKIAIIYHDADFDGKLSNEVCRFFLQKCRIKGSVVSYGWDYGRPCPPPAGFADWNEFVEIYIVDLSVDELMEREDLKWKIIWLDHHASSLKKYDGGAFKFNGYRIDGVAACRLCWQWFLKEKRYDLLARRIASIRVEELDSLPCPTKQEFIDRTVSEPELIRLAGEYDIWDHRDPAAKSLQFGLRALSDRDLELLVKNQFTGEPTGVKLDDVIAQGCAIKSYCDTQNDEYATACAHTIQWEGLSLCALNIGQRGNSDLLRAGLKPEHHACFAWRWTGNAVLVSLYHAPGHTELDLSTIAVKYGGGGHRGACGFQLTLPQLDQILNRPALK